jgi:hypothetical protein
MAKTETYQVKTSTGRYVKFNATKRRIVGNQAKPFKGVPIRKTKSK